MNILLGRIKMKGKSYFSKKTVLLSLAILLLSSNSFAGMTMCPADKLPGNVLGVVPVTLQVLNVTGKTINLKSVTFSTTNNTTTCTAQPSGNINSIPSSSNSAQMVFSCSVPYQYGVLGQGSYSNFVKTSFNIIAEDGTQIATVNYNVEIPSCMGWGTGHYNGPVVTNLNSNYSVSLDPGTTGGSTGCPTNNESSTNSRVTCNILTVQ